MLKYIKMDKYEKRLIFMIYNQILVRFGDLTLKGKNQKQFLNKEISLIRRKLAGLDVDIIVAHERVYINLKNEDYKKVIEHLDLVSGLSSYSLVVTASKELDDIKEKALALVKDEIKPNTKFKVLTRRADKKYPLDSMSVTKQVSGYVLANCGIENLKVDVHNPDNTLHVEIREEGVFLFLSDIRAMGGFPVGIAGKGLTMLSGGLDSPVAAYMAMKQGIEVECLHFESTPLTSIESSQKVVDLCKILAKYTPNNKINLIMVPFKELHMALLDNVDDSYKITVMRRMMFRIADGLARKRKALCIVTGESVGQVASQTLQSMNTINSVTNLPIIRPLVTTDKVDIVRTSYKIGTYETSIRPFEDCCTVYLPVNPATSPKIGKAEYYESKFDWQPMVDFCVNNVRILTITPESDYDLPSMGFEVRDVVDEIKNKNHEE
jgi:thiamine biosynthesis protein ThiI